MTARSQRPHLMFHGYLVIVPNPFHRENMVYYFLSHRRVIRILAIVNRTETQYEQNDPRLLIVVPDLFYSGSTLPMFVTLTKVMLIMDVINESLVPEGKPLKGAVSYSR